MTEGTVAAVEGGMIVAAGNGGLRMRQDFRVIVTSGSGDRRRPCFDTMADMSQVCRASHC